MAAYVAVALACYLVGSIPTGLLVGKAMRGIDIRRYGSGNIGATNALRVLGPKASAIVLAGDFAKGTLAVLATSFFLDAEEAKIIASLAALAGHNWSIYMGFQGGRGVATALGGFIVISPGAALFIILFGLAIMAVSRYVSLGSVIGAIAVILLTALLFFLGKISAAHLAYVVIGAGMVLLRHKDNLLRLMKGREHKLDDLGRYPLQGDKGQ